MTRFLLAFVGTVFLILVVASIFALKDSYKMLPLTGSDPSLMPEFADWHEFKPSSGSFQAKFPTIPQYGSQSVKDPKTGALRHYDMYIAEKSNGTIFMVSLIDFPDTTESMETLKKTIINDLLISNPQNQLKSMQVGTYKLFKTIDFVISNPATTVHGRCFSDGNMVYLLTAIFNNAFYNAAEYEYFINSFEWITPK